MFVLSRANSSPMDCMFVAIFLYSVGPPFDGFIIRFVSL